MRTLRLPRPMNHRMTQILQRKTSTYPCRRPNLVTLNLPHSATRPLRHLTWIYLLSSPKTRQRANKLSRKSFASSGWHLSRMDSRTISRRYVRCVCSLKGVSETERVRWWIGAESWPVTAGAPHRITCFWRRCIFLEFCRWWCERDGSCLGAASIAAFLSTKYPSTVKLELRLQKMLNV